MIPFLHPHLHSTAFLVAQASQTAAGHGRHTPFARYQLVASPLGVPPSQLSSGHSISHLSIWSSYYAPTVCQAQISSDKAGKVSAKGWEEHGSGQSHFEVKSASGENAGETSRRSTIRCKVALSPSVVGISAELPRATPAPLFLKEAVKRQQSG